MGQVIGPYCFKSTLNKATRSEAYKTTYFLYIIVVWVFKFMAGDVFLISLFTCS